MNDKIQELQNKNQHRDLGSTHYYGDLVRQIFIAMALIMLVATPFYNDRLPISASVSIIAVLILAIIAGLTNPKLRSVIIFDFVVSIASFLGFGWETISSYNVSVDALFYVNLILSILALFALYFSSKTLRGKFTSQAQ
jgi:hypothetical protein